MRHLWRVVCLSSALLTGVTAVRAAPVVRVAVQPFLPIVAPGATLTMTALVSGTTDQRVTWHLPGGATTGVITAAGEYTAPAQVPADNYVQICAASTADPQATDCVPVRVVVATPLVQVRAIAPPTAQPFPWPPAPSALAVGEARGRLHYAYIAGNRVQYARSHDAGTTWSPPVPVSRAVGMPRDVSLAASVAGHVYIAWQDQGAVQVTRSLDGGTTFATPVSVETDGPACCLQIALEMAEEGERVVLTATVNQQEHLQLLRSPPGDPLSATTWEEIPVTNLDETTAYWPAMAVDPMGHFHLLWSDGWPPTTGSRVHCAEMLDDTAVRTQSTLPGTGASDFAPAVTRYWWVAAQEASGTMSAMDTHVIWLRQEAATTTTSAGVGLYYQRQLNVANGCSALEPAPQRIDDPTVGVLLHHSYRPSIATDLVGHVAVAYYARSNQQTRLIVRESRDRGAHWGPAIVVNAGAFGLTEGPASRGTGLMNAPAIAYDDAGRLFVVGLLDVAQPREWGLRAWVIE